MYRRWTISGYGICPDDLKPYIDSEKLVNEIAEALDECDSISGDPYEYIRCCAWDNPAEFLCELANEGIDSFYCRYTYNDDGHGTSYCFFPCAREPHSELKRAIFADIFSAVTRFCNITESQLKPLVRQICEEGCEA